MTTSPRQSTFEGNQLWDDSGRLWLCKRTHWLPERDVARLIKRKHRIAVYRVEGGPVTWVEPAALPELWERVRGHVQVPGTAALSPDDGKPTYGAHLWRLADDKTARMLGLYEFC